MCVPSCTAALISSVGALLVTAGVAPAQEATRETVIEKCKAELAQRAQVALADIKLVGAEETVWPDGSLGCPEPGKMYTMALVPGYRIVLHAGEKDYEYHTNRTGSLVVYCANPPKGATGGKPPAPGEKPPAIQSGGPAARVVAYYLQDVPDEPNGNKRLMARDLGSPSASPEPVLDGCTDFAVSDTGLILAKRRTSRSAHDLLLARPGEEPKVLMRGFDFEGLTWLAPSQSYFFLAAAAVGAGWKMWGGEPNTQPVVLDWAPELKRARGADVIWRQNLVLVSIPAGDDTGTLDVLVLDLLTRKLVTGFRAPKAALGFLAPPGAAPAKP